MNPQIFLIKVNPEQWEFNGKRKDWGDINEGDWVPFNSDYKYQEDIKLLKAKDIILGYSCAPKMCIEALGRIFSDEHFNTIDEKRFLVQKTTQLRVPIKRENLIPIFEEDSRLIPHQPLVTKINPEIWIKIRDLILRSNPDAEADILRLESGEVNW